MFPVDPRLGTDFGEGAKEFLTEIKVNNFLPMHFWGMKDEALTFLSTIQGDRSNVHFISTPGASVEIKERLSLGIIKLPPVKLAYGSFFMLYYY